MRVLLAGEGKTDLGEWAKEPAYRTEPGEQGVLTALLERIAKGLTVVDGVVWKAIRKYRAGNHASAEERNVLGLALRALQTRCDALVFSRDRDGYPERERDVEAGIAKARDLSSKLEIVGGVAIENIEAWVLVLCGERGEELTGSRTKERLEVLGIATTRQKVDVVASAALGNLPPGSLATWVDRARSVLEPP